MGHEEIDRITKELEELLMTEEKNVTAATVAMEQAATTNHEPDCTPVNEPVMGIPDIQKAGQRVRKKEYQPRSLIRPYDGLAAAFLVPIVIMIIIFAQRGIFPFGEESFLRTDMYHQYAPFFSEFQDKLKNGGSLLYSWDIGMGVNFAALYAYYLASPLNWLLIICPKGLVIEFMTYSIVLKIGLCGLSMAYYLRKHCHTFDFGIAFFGIFYALSGYMAAYSWNIMWLDCILLFPLIVLGLERLVKDGKGMFYCITLGLAILSNYYISIMICIFMVLYFIALLVLAEGLTWERFIARSFGFCVYSLLAGGLAAAVLLPEIYALQLTASSDFNFPKTFSEYFSIFDMLARHIGNVKTEIGLDHWPNIYCGVAIFLFFGLYLACKKIPGREKVVYCVLLLFFFISFSINVLNFIWHGFHYPNSLPCRQSFIYIFLLLLMCYRAYMYLSETPWKHVLSAFWGSITFVILAQKLVTEEHFHFAVYYVAILFLVLYLGVICLYQKGFRYQNVAVLLALAVVAIEAATNTTVTSVTTTSRTAYTSDNAAVEKLVSQVKPGSTFFRMEKVTRKTKNDGAWMHFPSVSLFSSTANANLSGFFKKIGCESSTNAYSITGSTPFIDALFAVKYGIYSEEQGVSEMREFVALEEETWLYENLYTLPLGYWVAADFEDSWTEMKSGNPSDGNPADIQNGITDILGTAHVLNLQIDTETDGNKLTFYPEEPGEYYAYVSNKKIEKVTVSSWSGSKTLNNVDRGYLVEIGYCDSGEEVTLTAPDSKESFNASVYRFSEKGLAAVYDKLSANAWQLTKWTDTTLEGTITCEEEGLMMTSIPYEEGWQIWVDGKKQSAEPMFDDTFIGVTVTPGTHTVVIKYVPEGLQTGMLLTTVSAVILLLIWVSGRRRRLREAEEYVEYEEDEYEDDELELSDVGRSVETDGADGAADNGSDGESRANNKERIEGEDTL